MKAKKILLGLMCVFAGNAYAGATTGKVTTVFVEAGSANVKFGLDSATPNFNACAVQKLYVLTTSTQGGKNIYSAILAAKAAGQTIQVIGTDVCTLSPGSAEDIIYIAVL